MPRLGDVLGSVLAEAARGRVAADSLTRDLVAVYRDDPVLSLMSVPRVTVKQMQVTLRFAVEDFDEGPQQYVQPVVGEGDKAAWERTLAERVLPRLLEAQGPTLSGEEMRRVRDAAGAEAPSVATDRLVAAATGDPQALVDESVEAVVARIRSVPTALRRRLGTLAQVREQIRPEIAVEVETFLAGYRRKEDIRRILGSRLDVAVRGGDLSAVAPEVVQEVTVTLEMSDLDTILDGAELTPGEATPR